VLLGIGCILFIVLSLMGVKYVTYHRRRQEYLEQFQVRVVHRTFASETSVIMNEEGTIECP
jgi:hypothetical protein